jgi:PKD domain
MKKWIKEMLTVINKKSILLAILFSALIYLGHEDVALSQLTGDPTIDPIPVLDLDTSEKSIVVLLLFREGYEPEVQSVKIVPGPNRARAGNPPYLDVTLYDLGNNALEGFHAWHPLMLFTAGNPGPEPSFVMLSEAIGVFGFPFRGDVATMIVSDSKTQSKLVSVDLIPGLHKSCRAMPDDPDCTNIVNRLPNCNADGPYKAECAGRTTSVALDGRGSSDPDGDPLTYTWSGAFIEGGGTITGATATVQFQGHGNFSVNLELSDDFGGQASCSSSVDVVDTKPPTITSVSASPNTLWPANHKMVPVTINVIASDICDAKPMCKITSVISNEPVNGLGDGDTAPDWEITGDKTLNLRAERSGTGKGRVYTITATCTDTTGNTATGTATVTVPHDQKK